MAVTRRAPLACAALICTAAAACFRSGFGEGAAPRAPRLEVISHHRAPIATFAPHDDEDQVAAFICALDDGPRFRCTSPLEMVDLAPGPHSISVRALDRRGVVGPPRTKELLRGSLPKGLDGAVHAIAPLPDGSVVVAGDFAALRPEPAAGLIALDLQGAPSIDCLAGGGFNGAVKALLGVGDAYFAAGHFTAYRGVRVGHIVKLDRQCNIDPQFQDNVGGGFGYSVEALAVVGDALFAAGHFWDFDGEPTARNIAKLDLAGRRDRDFDQRAGAGFDSIVWAMAAHQGRLYLGGDFSSYGGAPTADGLARIEPSGELDSTFCSNARAGVAARVGAFAFDSGHVYITRGAPAGAGVLLAKLDLAGNVDAAFAANIGTGFDVWARALALLDGAIYVGGFFTTFNEEDVPFGLIRLNLDGTRDRSFPPPPGIGIDWSDSISDLASHDGAIYATGFFDSFNGAPVAASVLKLDSGGHVDQDFQDHVGAGLRGGGAGALAVLGETLLVSGDFSNRGGGAPIAAGIARLDAQGELDAAFDANAGLGFDGGVRALAQADGALFVGGDFVRYNGELVYRLAKLHGDGTLDRDFQRQIGEGFNGSVRALAVAGSDLYVGGTFSAFDNDEGAPDCLVKLDLSGRPDIDFWARAGSGFDSWVYTLAVEGTALYAGGFFTGYNGLDVPNGLLKLSTSGDPDQTFVDNAMPGFGPPDAYGAIHSLALAGGAVYAGGHFMEYRGQPVAGELIKLDAQGRHDAAFSESLGLGPGCCYVRALLAAGDALFVAGGFDHFDDQIAGRLVKLGLDGARDEGFSTLQGTGFNADVRALGQSQGQLYVGGDFGGCDERSSAHLARLGADGAVDPFFHGDGDRD